MIYNATRWTIAPEAWLPITVVYEKTLLGDRSGDKQTDQTKQIDFTLLMAALDQQEQGARVVLDIELWTMNTAFKPWMFQNIQKMADVANFAKAYRPDLNIGMFGTPPKSSPQGALEDTEDWHRLNKHFQLIADQVDTIYPAIYCRYQDFDKQYLVIDNTLRECEQYGKEIIPFVCPRYTELQDAGEASDYDPLPLSVWQAMLDVYQDRGISVAVWDASRFNAAPDFLNG